jgi:hypothetical protein
MCCNIDGSIFMERQISIENLFKTKIHNKRILLLEPNCDLQNSTFCGLNFSLTTEYDTLYNLDDIERFANTHWDYIIGHVFHIRKFTKTEISLFSTHNITCDTLVCDELGEGFSLNADCKRILFDLEFDKILKLKTVKWLTPFYDYSSIQHQYPNVEFFSEKHSGLLLFCGKSNRMIHGDTTEALRYSNKLTYGLSWKPELKERLFLSLNNETRTHRSLLIHYLTEENLLDKGYVSYLNPPQDLKLQLNFKTYLEKLNVKRLILPWESEIDEINRFGIQINAAEKTYIDVVTESSTGLWPFKTEKCLKPFYNLQFPMIFGHEGIIQDLRDVGFDLFDDIINHDYDDGSNQPGYINRISNDMDLTIDGYNDNKRIPFLVKELKRLSTLDIKKIYENNKDRFLKNQQLVWDLTIKENKILYKVGKFVFGDDIEFFDTPIEDLKKVYL